MNKDLTFLCDPTDGSVSISKKGRMYYEWVLLDTHDGLTDFYKHYRRPNQISKLLEDIDTKDIIVEIGGNGIEAFCKKRIVLNSTASLATETLLQKQL